ncbi:MAG: S9 family peptidase [Gemmatimonadota bacterium]|nr:MAG: S9 family peptidase [Gemmatimonadota bacterium]
MRSAVAIVSLALFAASMTAASAQAQEEPGYSIKDFLSVTAFSQVTVSPDGRYVALVSQADNFERNRRESAIWRIDLDRRVRVTERVRLAASARSYSQLRWSPDSRYLAFLSSKQEGDTRQLYVLDMRGGEPWRLADPERFSDGISTYDWAPGGTEIIFAASLPQTPEEKHAHETFYGDVMRFAERRERSTVERVRVALAAEPAQRIATVDFPVATLRTSPDGSWIALVSDALSKPQRFYNDFAENELYLVRANGESDVRQLTHNFVQENLIQWRRRGEGLYATGLGYVDATRGRWTQGRIFRIAMDGRVENVAPGFPGELGPPYADGPFTQLPDGSLLTSAVVSTRTNIYRVDPDAGRVEPLTDFRGAVSNLSVSPDGKVIAFALVTDQSAPEVYVASGVSDLRNARRVTDFNTEFNSLPRPEIEATRWPNGEGDEIEGVLYWPPGQRGDANLPLIVDIHGGPWSVRTENLGPFGFAYYPALLASRGYLVLEPNYRGGTGRGDAFLHAIEGYSCSRPAIDVLTGVDYLVQQGWADPDRMGVMGYSYGGLMTNCLITKTDRFRAAASGAGLWNDISYFGTADNFIQNDVRNLGLAPWENLQNYWEESAISGAGNIITPTLIVIGGADRRVPTTQGYELYRALVRLGVPAELLIFPGEDHGFVQPVHKLTKVQAEIRWLDHYILGEEGARD